jgi:hypothetical protein
MRRWIRRSSPAFVAVFAALGLSLGLTAKAHAQGEGGWSAADAAALKAYTLDMDKLRRTGKAMAELDRLPEARQDTGDDEGVESLNALVQRVEAVPAARGILRKHGLTPREYVLAMVASMHAATAVLLEENGQKATGLPVSAGQVAFYQKNKAEVDQMLAARKAATADPSEEDEQ